MIKTILVPLFGEGRDDFALGLAHCVASQFNAHIDAVHVGRNSAYDVLRITMGNGRVTRELWDQLERDIRHRRETARNCFDHFCKSRNVPIVESPRASPSLSAKWSEFEGDFATEIGLQGRFHELTVIGRGDDKSGFTQRELGDILVRIGRPMLLAPRMTIAPKALETIAIAWKDTAESARMMTAALPFIKTATKVVILTASEGRDSSADIDSAERLAEELRWHGIEPDLRCLSPRDGKPEVALVDAAAEANADLLVLGGYGHSRALEFVLGGVTRYMLKTADFPVLIVH